MVRAAIRGADTVMAVSPLVTGLQRIMVRPAIRTPADIRGKKIGVTRFGSASHWVEAKQSDDEAAVMEDLERRILKSLGISDPYE